ncbi:response regulator with CheY-like receiver, AAA-type ATPase, and DNA-binding domains [Allocoleopsis franciscana PCC 7113]|uniref:Response regulator with CheY-like receiver, AAA-type ATPase, and DNA-binding domains n=2 Tax=Allocoleopsis TaxID=2886347 RepID=K9WF54_9CYAN|nr:response regulator with CheY-like receiver, AAA-type ATPase, and DNA-binding domains [Allocoleopsis franciscana PCC 7113]
MVEFQVIHPQLQLLLMPEKRILVIDDEINLCTVIQACLENLGGWETLTALSGKEGLAIAQTQQLDAILLDVMMPDMDGLTLFEKLQNDSTTQAIPVILFTAKVQSTDIAQFAKLGVAGVIAKPFDPLTLAEQVASMLGW